MSKSFPGDKRRQEVSRQSVTCRRHGGKKDLGIRGLKEGHGQEHHLIRAQRSGLRLEKQTGEGHVVQGLRVTQRKP